MQGLRVPDLGMEARMEEESRSSSQHLFVTVEGTPASHSCNNIKEWEMDALQQNGTSYESLMRRNTELLKAVEELERTCITLREENTLLRKSSSPETEEKVKRLKRKNAELANIARRLEERARKLQEANLRVVNSPAPVKGYSLEHYKKAFARQCAKDLSEHADIILAKDKEIEELRQECRDLHAKLGPSTGAPDQLKQSDFERVLRESQKEVLRLQRQLSVVSLQGSLHLRGQGTPTAEISSVHPLLSLQDTTEFSKTTEVTELCKKRKECESHEQEIKKRQRICQDLENELKQVWSENARLTEETIRLTQQAQETDKIKAQNNDLRERLSVVTAERDSVLKENQRLQAKLENLEQVLKHMREVAERRHQLQLEHDGALTILQAKQNEVERLQQAQFDAKKEHEGMVQLLEALTYLVLQRELAKVRDLEEKCRSQSSQFSVLSQELEHFRLQTGNIDLLTNTLVNSDTSGLIFHSQPQLLNGVEPPSVEKVAEEIPPSVCESPSPPQDEKEEEQEEEQVPDEPQVQSVTVSQKEEEIATEVGTISSKIQPESNQSSSKETPKTELSQSSPKSCTTPEVDTASEVEELDIDNVSSIPEPESRVTAKLKVFIARYSYNPFDGPNENPEAELPLTAGEYIYVFGDMDDDGFYEGELMDGRRGLVPSNFIERVSDEDMLTFHPPETNDLSHSSFQEMSFHSGSEQSLPLQKNSIEMSETSSPHEDLTLHDSQIKPESHVSNGFELNADEIAEYNEDVMPYPRKMKLIKQLAKSIIISWEPPLVPGGWGTIYSYNIYVDKELRMNVNFGAQTKAVIERLDLNAKAYRICVQCVTDKGNSDEICSSMLVGKDVCVAPIQLKIHCITATSADISWLPSNSNYSHAIFLNEEEYEVVKAGCYSCALMNIRPNMKYKVKVEARPHQMPWELPPDRRQLKCVYTQFATLAAGPPDAPLDVQIEAGPTQDVVIISWLPVTIDAAGTSNGVRVTGYAVYADGQKIIEVMSPTAGSVLARPSQIQLLQVSTELAVRTMSPYGESIDSNPIKIPRALFTFPSHSMPLQTAPEKCPHPDINVPLSNELPNVDFSDESLSGITCDQALTMDSATSCNGNQQENTPSEFNTLSQVDDTKPNIEEPACVQEDIKMTENLKAGAAGLFDYSKENKDEEHLKEVTDHLENAQLKRSVAFIEEFLEDLEQKENIDIKEDSNWNHLESDPRDQMMEIRTVQAPINRTQECKEEIECDVSPTNIRVPSIEEFLSDIELKEEKIHVSVDEKMIEEGQLGSEVNHLHVVKADNHENEDYPPDNSRGSDLSDIMEEDEEDLGSDSQANDDLQNHENNLNRENSLKQPEQYETDSDEEFLEKILELPLQKHCSKKLFSIPEVTKEEEDEQEEKKEEKEMVEEKKEEEEEEDKETISGRTQDCTQNQKQGIEASNCSQDEVHVEDQIFNCMQTSSNDQSPRDQVSNLETKNKEMEKQPVSKINLHESTNLEEGATGLNGAQSELEFMDREEDLLFNNTYDQRNKQEPSEKHTRYPRSNFKKKEWCEEASYKFHNRHSKECIRSPDWKRKTSEYTHKSTIDDHVLESTPDKSQSEESHRDILDMTVVDPSSLLQMQSRTQITSMTPEKFNVPVTGSTHYNNMYQASHKELEIDIEYGTEEEEEIPSPNVHFCSNIIHLDQMKSGWSHGGQKHNEDECSQCSQYGSTHSNDQSQASVKYEVFDLNSGYTKSPHCQKRRDKATLPRNQLHRAQGRLKGKITEEKKLEALKMETYDLGRTRARTRTEYVDSACTPDFVVDLDSGSHCAPDSPAVRALNPQNSSSLRLGRGESFVSKALRAETSRSQESSILDGFKDIDPKGMVDGVLVRIFVALFDYDPATMSPNPDAAEEELAFKEGQILKVYGDKDADGFYRGEANGQTGFVPCNMVSEIQVDDDDVMEQLLLRGYLAPSTSMEKLSSHMLSQPPRRSAPPLKPRRSKKVHSNTWKEARQREWNRPSGVLQNLPMKRMMAVFDYDPRESSPNVDIEAELTFSAGDIIAVYGDMDEDGFYYGDLNGVYGLAPSNFLELISAEETVDTTMGNAQLRLPQNAVQKEKQLSLDEEEDSNRVGTLNIHPNVTAGCLDNHGYNENSNSKKKKGFFSKGKKLFKRLGSSKRE
ncbi:peripheral-type benzodiazepine receptor-associated protein 1 isoform X2 [Amblyraja radiata]|uniref:peripheral-type benzodiazepine receptor-associated protein 1 isoform X2 n=1 Tax=Amblyraja radiata TaxID=386614 RepID=UPI001401D57C|nr:peripheral-type benzodiazepine receptor-associated protein 1 isoform X2 [Amblyraja radiata]